jgi:hypothetical protein
MKELRLFDELYAAKGNDLVRTIDAIREAVSNADEPFEAVRRVTNDKKPDGLTVRIEN